MGSFGNLVLNSSYPRLVTLIFGLIVASWSGWLNKKLLIIIDAHKQAALTDEDVRSAWNLLIWGRYIRLTKIANATRKSLEAQRF